MGFHLLFPYFSRFINLDAYLFAYIYDETWKARSTGAVVGVDGVQTRGAVLAVVEDAVVNILLAQHS